MRSSDELERLEPIAEAFFFFFFFSLDVDADLLVP